MLLPLVCPELPVNSGSAVLWWPSLSLPQGVSTAWCMGTPRLPYCGTWWSLFWFFVWFFFKKKKHLNS